MLTGRHTSSETHARPVAMPTAMNHLRADVAERQRNFVLVDYIRRDFLADDLSTASASVPASLQQTLCQTGEHWAEHAPCRRW